MGGAKANEDISELFISGEVEYILLEAFQNGSEQALIDLMRSYFWFIDRLALTFSKGNKARYGQRVLDILAIFWDAAERIDLSNEERCFLEDVYVQVDHVFEETKRKKRARRYRKLLELERACKHVSLDEPQQFRDNETLVSTLGVPDDQHRAVSAFDRIIAVPSLSRTEEKILTMLYVEDMSIDTIAHELKIKTERVRQKRNLAHRKIRNHLLSIGFCAETELA